MSLKSYIAKKGNFNNNKTKLKFKEKIDEISNGRAKYTQFMNAVQEYPQTNSLSNYYNLIKLKNSRSDCKTIKLESQINLKRR